MTVIQTKREYAIHEIHEELDRQQREVPHPTNNMFIRKTISWQSCRFQAPSRLWTAKFQTAKITRYQVRRMDEAIMKNHKKDPYQDIQRKLF